MACPSHYNPLLVVTGVGFVLLERLTPEAGEWRLWAASKNDHLTMCWGSALQGEGVKVK